MDRHPHSRPLPGPPGPDADSDYFRNGIGPHTHLTHEEAEALTQEELFNQVEDAVRNAGGAGTATAGHSPTISVTQAPLRSSSPRDGRIQRNGSIINGHLSTAPPEPQYSDDSDAEAAQGLAMIANGRRGRQSANKRR